MSTRAKRRSGSDETSAPAEPSTPHQSPRARLLEQGPIDTGLGWATTWREQLRNEGRPAVGGWPGTLKEAHVRVTAYLAAELGRRRMLALSYEEEEAATRIAYASARRHWLAHRDADEPTSE